MIKLEKETFNHVVRTTPTTKEELMNLLQTANDFITKGRQDLELIIREPELFQDIPDIEERKRHFVDQIETGQQLMKYLQQDQFDEVWDQ